MTDSKRFEFGRNWQAFLSNIADCHIAQARCSLQEMLEIKSLEGKSFLDVGSGSGLFSLAARKLGAQVHSFDYDPQSVACTSKLKQRFSPEDMEWKIERGNVLDINYLQGLGKFDVVYAWGVLHHTGNMWDALNNLIDLVENDGRLFIAIYNHQRRATSYWMKIKKTYNCLPKRLKFLILVPTFLRLWGPTMLRDFLKGKPFYTWKNYGQNRGMSAWRDVIDWVGGFPFEVARPEEIFDFYRERGFLLKRLKTCGSGHGCNEFVFQKSS